MRITGRTESQNTSRNEGTSKSAGAMALDDDNDTCGIDEFDVLSRPAGLSATSSTTTETMPSSTPRGSQDLGWRVVHKGWNGPAGWTDSPAPSDYPLPGAPEYSLIGRLGNGPWQYIGNRAFTFHQEKEGYWQKVVLRTNDNNPGNGDGAFYATSNCS